jgi:hypothetical protein
MSFFLRGRLLLDFSIMPNWSKLLAMNEVNYSSPAHEIGEVLVNAPDAIPDLELIKLVIRTHLTQTSVSPNIQSHVAESPPKATIQEK